MHVIGRDNSDMQEVLNVTIVQTTLQRHGSSGVRQDPSMKCAEGYEVALVIAPKMRELAAIEWHSEAT